MKADLTRDTFHPLKHYIRVLTQQGRVQLDADSNEQTAITLRYMRQLAADLIGPAGGPATDLGFAVTPLSPSPSPADFRIGFGSYYARGLLCQADYLPIGIFAAGAAAAGVYQVRNWSADFEQKTIPTFELFDDNINSTFTPIVVQITDANQVSGQITIGGLTAAAAALTRPTLRRIITYLHQPDYVYSTAAGAISPPPLPSGFCQIYLDIWERVITYAEDDLIREVALGGPDTAARTKLVWQVKWMQTDANDRTCAVPAPVASRGWLQAMAKQTSRSTNPCIIDPNAAYTGPENQLYRVEINRGGTAGDDVASSATFKWSRENGSVIFPIASGGGTAAVVLESLGRDDRFGLVEGSLVEVQDDRSVLLNMAGRLLPVQAIDRTTTTVMLGGTPDSTLGRDATLHPLLRRWDQSAGDPDEGGLTLANDNAALVQEGVWLTLEDGVQIRFQPADPVAPAPGQTNPVNTYITGDYWLIPARTATGDVEWPKVTDAQGNPETDAQGNVMPLALPPNGVRHYYAPLAVVNVGPAGVTRLSDCRSSFEPLAEPVVNQ